MRRLSDQTLRRLGRAVSGLNILSAPLIIILMALAGVLDQIVENFSLINAFVGVCYGVLGLVLITSEPRNRLVWFFIAIGFCSASHEVINGGIELLAADQGVHAEQIDTTGWPPGVATLVAYSYSVWVFQFYALPTIGLLLAPTGRLLSRRWLPVALVPVLCIPVMWIIAADRWPIRDGEPPDDGSLTRWAFQLGFTALFLAFVAALVSLVLRYRGSSSAHRRRLRWVLFGSAVYLVSMSLAIAGAGNVFLFLWYGVLPVCYGLAIWRDQLFDVDVVISRTVLFAFLALFIGTVYIGVVFGIGSLIGTRTEGNQALSLLATVVVAFLFHPVRQRLERAANRLVYGPRATPYEVLSDLSGRLAQTESTSGLLDRMVALVADGTGAERAVVWRWSDGSHEPLAVWPADLVIEPTTELDHDDRAVPIGRSGQRLGTLTVTKRRGEELNPTEQRLLDDLAGSAGLVLDRARLDAALSEQADALVQSRRRLISAQDEERQRLEQQLQTGTQQHLSGLVEGLDAATAVAAREGLDPIVNQLAALVDETRLAQAEIRTLAQGVYPPVLETQGLTAAVQNLATALPIAVEVQSTASDRNDLDLELAVYFCIAEALTNVVKHAQASTVAVRLDQERGALSFTVSDDGIGFGLTAGNGSSTGLSGLRDRIEAVGGGLDVSSTPGQGTTIAGSVATASPSIRQLAVTVG